MDFLKNPDSSDCDAMTEGEMFTETEKKYVIDTYSKISKEFHLSRWKPWPSVKSFIDKIPEDKNLADIGCGNCKNLLLKPLNSVGVDIIPEFIEIGKSLSLNVILGSILDIPLPDNSYDNTISIAVLHHLSTPERRLKGFDELIRITKPGGKIFIQVWAYEQPETSKHKFIAGDNMVPWKSNTGEEMATRYYFVYDKNTFINFILSKTYKIKIDNIFLEYGNWVALLTKI